MNDIPVLSELAARFDAAVAGKPQVLRGAGTPHRRRLALAAAAVVLAVSAFAIGSYNRPEKAVAGVPLSLVDGKLAVSYQQVLDNPGDVESQLAAAGLEVTIEEVPASPGMVGKVRWSMGASPVGDNRIDRWPDPWIVPSCGDPRVCEPWWPSGSYPDGEPQGYEAGLLVPLDFDGSTEIHIGRAAHADEQYLLDQHPLAPGEPLFCRVVLMETVTEAQAALTDTDVPVVWRARLEFLPEDVLAHVDVDGDEVVDDLEAVGDLLVADAFYADDQTVHLWVADEQHAEAPDLQANARRIRDASAGC